MDQINRIASGLVTTTFFVVLLAVSSLHANDLSLLKGIVPKGATCGGTLAGGFNPFQEFARLKLEELRRLKPDRDSIPYLARAIPMFERMLADPARGISNSSDNQTPVKAVFDASTARISGVKNEMLAIHTKMAEVDRQIGDGIPWRDSPRLPELLEEKVQFLRQIMGLESQIITIRQQVLIDVLHRDDEKADLLLDLVISDFQKYSNIAHEIESLLKEIEIHKRSIR